MRAAPAYLNKTQYFQISLFINMPITYAHEQVHLMPALMMLQYAAPVLSWPHAIASVTFFRAWSLAVSAHHLKVDWACAQRHGTNNQSHRDRCGPSTQSHAVVRAVHVPLCFSQFLLSSFHQAAIISNFSELNKHFAFFCVMYFNYASGKDKAC